VCVHALHVHETVHIAHCCAASLRDCSTRIHRAGADSVQCKIPMCPTDRERESKSCVLCALCALF